MPHNNILISTSPVSPQVRLIGLISEENNWQVENLIIKQVLS